MHATQYLDNVIFGNNSISLAAEKNNKLTFLKYILYRLIPMFQMFSDSKFIIVVIYFSYEHIMSLGGGPCG